MRSNTLVCICRYNGFNTGLLAAANSALTRLPRAARRNLSAPEQVDSAMKWMMLAFLPIAACTTPQSPQNVASADPPLVIPQSPPPESIQPGFNRATVEAILLASARARYGEALVRRAIAAPAFLFTKHYPGMMPPPPPGAGPDWRYPEPPVAMLFRENGQWLAARAEGLRAAKPDKVGEIEAILADPAFWAEPEYAEPGCTDAGASLLMLKLPDRARITRRSACGATQRGEHLVFRALEA